jgi:hypothetical protein
MTMKNLSDEQQEEKIEMTTLTSLMSKLKEEGFPEDFIMMDGGIGISGTDKIYKPENIKILDFFRFEGESDPADMSILYAIETNDGKRGLFSHPYGAYAETEPVEFFTRVEEINKKTDKDGQEGQK